jgi:hypothetical protein
MFALAVSPEIAAAVIVALVAGLFVGSLVERIALERYIRLKAGPEHRSAVCLGGEFYYVLPEHEYCEEILPALHRDWNAYLTSDPIDLAELEDDEDSN